MHTNLTAELLGREWGETRKQWDKQLCTLFALGKLYKYMYLIFFNGLCICVELHAFSWYVLTNTFRYTVYMYINIVHTSLLGLTVEGVFGGIQVALSPLSVVILSGPTPHVPLGCLGNGIHERDLFKVSIRCKSSESTGNEVCTPRRRKMQRCTTPLQASIKTWSKETSFSGKEVK